jgi:acetyl-CoA hydrolase
MKHDEFSPVEAAKVAGGSDATTHVPDLSALIRPGDTVMWGQSHAEPVTLMRALRRDRADATTTRTTRPTQKLIID